MTKKLIMPENRNQPVAIDLIIPMYNEEDVIPHLLERLDAVFSDEARELHDISRIRLIAVDDGSKDETASLLRDSIVDGRDAVLLCMSRNFGHQAAVCAGIDEADADVAVVIDADLQDSPELIPDMLTKWRQGYDIVYAVRRHRDEAIWKRCGYYLFYRILSWLTEGRIPNDSGDFCLLDRCAVQALRSLPEHLRFMRGLRAWVGFRQVGIPCDRPNRVAGKSKYSFGRLYALATDGIASSSIRPLQIVQFSMLLFFFITLVATISVGGMIVLEPDTTQELRTTYFLMILVSFLGLFSSMSFYVLGAYIGRMYLEVKGRPTYLLAERIDGASK